MAQAHFDSYYSSVQIYTGESKNSHNKMGVGLFVPESGVLMGKIIDVIFHRRNVVTIVGYTVGGIPKTNEGTYMFRFKISSSK